MKSRVTRQVDKSDLPWVKRLLEDNGLPTVGVDEWYDNFVIAMNEKGGPVGVAGFELYNRNALLRSVAVEKDCRNAGTKCSCVCPPARIWHMPAAARSCRSDLA